MANGRSYSAAIDSNGNADVYGVLQEAPSGTYLVEAFHAAFNGPAATGVQVAAPTTTTVSCSPNPLTVGQTADCTVHVSPAASGSVTFDLVGIDTTANLDGNSNALIPGQFLGAPAQTYTVTATYNGDATHDPSTGTTTVTVQAPPPSPPTPPPPPPTTITTVTVTGSERIANGVWDSGYVSLTINGVTKTVEYGQFSSRQSVAAYLAALFAKDCDGPAKAKADASGNISIVIRRSGSLTQLSASWRSYILQGSSFIISYAPVGTQAPPTNPTPPPPSGGGGTVALPAGALYAYRIAKSDGTSGYDGVGNIVSYADTANGQWAASYDSLNRIAGASQIKVGNYPSVLPPANGTQQNFCWLYDSFGNRTLQSSSDQPFGGNCQAQPSSMFAPVFAVFDESNRVRSTTLAMGGYIYDASGNVLDDGVNQYLYDDEGRMCASRTIATASIMTGYLYDAEGQRVAKGSLSSWSCDPAGNGFQMTNEYISGPNGEPLTELDGQGNWLHTNVHANGQLIATYDANGLHYQLNDWLGTRRVQTDASGNVQQSCSGGSFGDQLLCTGAGADATEHHFTGKERDTESGLDYFGARYYASGVGRWLSPDPSNWGVDFYNPQTWNHYLYVGNNPLLNTDPNGLWLKPTHESIIDHAFPGLSKEQRQILKEASKRVDEDQSQAGSYKHALTNDLSEEHATLENPEYATAGFIEQNEHEAKEIQAAWIASGHSGISPSALAAFGNAGHSISDSYSPAHVGYQMVNHKTIVWHILRETTLFGRHKWEQQQATGALQTAFFNVFGSALGEQATHEKVTVKLYFNSDEKMLDQK